MFSTNDDSLMRYKGLLNPTNSVDTDVSEITGVDVSGSSTYSITATRNDGTSYNCVADSYKNYPTKNGKAYYLDGKNFSVENTSGTDLDVTFTDTAHTIICDTNGSVNSIYKDDSEVRVLSNGDDIDYNVSVIFNEGSYDFTPHYRWNFEGSTDSQINIRQTDRGLLVSGENGVNCKLTTYDVTFDEEHYVDDTENNCNTAELSSTETLMVYFDENDELKYYEIGKGDINADGSVNIADAVMLQKFLLGSGTLTAWKSADLCKDERVDVFDMILMRQMLTS